jgi:hypothetical protein
LLRKSTSPKGEVNFPMPLQSNQTSSCVRQLTRRSRWRQLWRVSDVAFWPLASFAAAAQKRPLSEANRTS